MNLQPNSLAYQMAEAVPSHAIATSFEIEVFDDPRYIEREWCQLETSGIATVFQRYDWIETYARRVLPHENAQPAIVLGRLGGRPAFILPLAISTMGPARIATWIGGKHSSYNFGLWSPEGAAVMASLGRAGIERLLGTAIRNADGAVLGRVPKIHGTVAQPLAALPGMPSPTEGYSLDLAGGFEAVLVRSSSGMRCKRVRKRERKMSESGALRYRTSQDPAQAAAALEFFSEHKALRLVEQGRSNSFAEPGVMDFFRELLGRSHTMDEPLLEMAELSVGGETRAVLGCGIHRGRVNVYFSAFANDELASRSPGLVLTFRHIEDCCRRGLAAYDLGVGYEDYKTHWCDIVHKLDDLYAAFTPVGMAAIAAIRLGDAAKNHIRRSRPLLQHLRSAQPHPHTVHSDEGYENTGPAETTVSASASASPLRGPLAGRRMLFIAPDDYPAFRVDLTELFSNHLVSRGLEIDWSLRPCEDGPARVDVRGPERFHVARRAMSEKFGSLRYMMAENRLRLKLAWRAARGEYDLIQVRDQPLWGVAYGIAARLSGKPLVFWMSFPVLEGRKRTALYNLVPMSWPSRLIRLLYAVVGSAIFYRIALPLADHVIVQSKRMRERVGDHGIATAKMTPVPMGVSTERYNAQSIRPADDPRLAGRKSMAYMCADIFSATTRLTFDALAELVADGYDAVLIIIGTVSRFEQEKLTSQLDTLGLSDRVIFTGRLLLAEALGWIKCADVCLSPFEMDVVQQVATPTKLVEYLAMGRPVVATVHYDQNEVVHGSGAGIVTAFSGKAMAEGIARLFDDPEKAEAMGARGPVWIKANRDYARLADVVERVYADLLNGRQVSDLEGEERVAAAG